MSAWGWVRRVGLLLLTVALVEYLAVPQLLQARKELSLFSGASPWLLLLAFGLEASSLLAYTTLTQSVLRHEVQLAFSAQLRIDLTGLGASHLLPGGGASAAALRYRLMTGRGVPPADALSTAAVQTAIGVTGLVATFTGGVVLALPGIWSHPAYLLAGAGGLALLVVVAVSVRTLAPSPPPVPALSTRHRQPAAHRRASRWLVRRLSSAASGGRAVLVRGSALLREREHRRALLGWATANWLLDAVSLWCCLWAYGIVVHPGALLAAYGAANLVGLLPITPGGLGIVEGVLIPSLIALGAAGGPVVLGVLTWRALEFWLPIPVAGLSYLSLRFPAGAMWVRRSHERR